MNIKEIKANYEKATKIVVESMLSKDVKVETGYNMDAGVMSINLISNTKGKEGEDVVVVYNVAYGEEKKTLSVAAIARHIVKDYFGEANVVYEPIFIDDNFVLNMKQGVAAALEHSDEIIKAEEEKKATANADENAATVDDKVETPAADEATVPAEEAK